MVKWEICPSCEGEGYVGTLGAYTSDEFAEAFEDADEYRALHEASLEACGTCKGQRVLSAEALAEWEEDAEARAEHAAEMRYGC